MSRYAVDLARREVITVWGSGLGDVASRVASLPEAASDDDALALIDAANSFTREVWRTYTHPASAAGDDTEVNTEAWRRKAHRDAFSWVEDAIRKPNLPSGGAIVQSYNPVEESAHRVGRALHRLGNPALREVMIVDLAAELAAVESAERGDLTGRARQAVLLTRADASPVQVAAADALLRADPFGTDQLFTEFDPTAAAVAAAGWLFAAAEVTAELCDMAPSDVLVEADNIEALPHQSPTIILELIEEGLTPEDAVLLMVEDAMQAAEGEIPDILALLSRVEAVQQQAGREGREDPDDLLDDQLPNRLTPLDTTRPALDLLEDLLIGVRGCFLLYTEVSPMLPAQTDRHPDDELGDAERDDEDAREREVFIDALRAHVAEGTGSGTV